jgi:hypothetical protein
MLDGPCTLCRKIAVVKSRVAGVSMTAAAKWASFRRYAAILRRLQPRAFLEGKFYTCLFATHGIDLRAPMRDSADDAELLRIIRGAWLGRTDRYSELREELRRDTSETKKIEMYYIGG